MNHAKILKGQPCQDALSKLVPDWYETFPPDHTDLVEIYQPTGMSNKTSIAIWCAEDQILEHLILCIRFDVFALNNKSINRLESGYQEVNIHH